MLFSSVTEAISQWLDENVVLQQAGVVVAYSGGRDSHVLLHALWQQRLLQSFAFELSAIHVNHGLQPEAKDWARHCAEICQSYDIPLQVVDLQLNPPPGESVENYAREQRYLAFAKRLKPEALLLTAHNRDDQAETFVLQLIRGAGIKGLAAIAPSKSFAKGQLARPLLSISRAQITEYAKHFQLSWIEDKSNDLLRFRRNFLRHQVMPLLKTVNPSVDACIARSAKHCRETQELLDEYIQQDFQRCLSEKSDTLDVAALKALSGLKQQYVLRYWFECQGVPFPSSRKLQHIIHQMLTASEDATPCVEWANIAVRRHKGQLYLQHLTHKVDLPFFKQKDKLWNLNLPLPLGEGEVWQANLVQGKGIKASKLSHNTLRIAYRQGGERCKPVGRMGSRPLKKLLQELAIPHWERAQLPLFYHEDELVGVGDLFICEGWQASSEEQGWVIKKSLLACLQPW
ncbi:MAG: tRNA lysidine(34) synthetase TilS [Gammaproteobacteria bacterium]|nr:tRNA lysidine(34) synthetase TilS [Gammaproteobacteria bacterium]